MKIYTLNIMKVYGIFTGLMYKKLILLFQDKIISFPIWIIGYDRQAGLEAREALESYFESYMKEKNEQ